jgi:hypothetical protein
MAITVNFNGATLVKPGSYSDVRVTGSTVASPALGVVALIGESTEGAPFSEESGLSAVTFGPDEFAAIAEKFGSGPLVDAAKLAISPSNDPAIRGGAQELVLIKTNATTKASLTLPSYGTVTDKRGGIGGNQISVQVALVSGSTIITINDLQKGLVEVSDPIGGNTVMTLQCTDGAASAATVTLTDKKLTTAVTGGSTAQNLDIDLSTVSNVAKLVELINQNPGYSASAASATMGAKPVSVLDKASAAGILVARDFDKDLSEVKEFFAASSLVDFSATATAGVPSVMARTLLSGGAKGATSQADIQDGIDALLKRRINFVIPLFSRDAADDISDDLTDAASSYSIASVHAAVRSHCNEASTIKGRKERQGFVGFKGSFDEAIEAASDLNAYRVQMAFQDVDAIAASGELVTMQPHMLAVLSAGMKASALPGLSNLNKAPSISGFSHADFDPETQAEKAIRANLCYVEKAPNGGYRFAMDNTTYQDTKDAWIFNRPSVIYAADLAAYTLRLNTEAFIGVRNSDLSEESIRNSLISVFDSLKSAGIIVGDNNTGGRGYKDLTIKLEGSIIRIGVTLALVENYEFVLSDIRVQRAA